MEINGRRMDGYNKQDVRIEPCVSKIILHTRYMYIYIYIYIYVSYIYIYIYIYM